MQTILDVFYIYFFLVGINLRRKVLRESDGVKFFFSFDKTNSQTIARLSNNYGDEVGKLREKMNYQDMVIDNEFVLWHFNDSILFSANIQIMYLFD